MTRILSACLCAALFAVSTFAFGQLVLASCGSGCKELEAEYRAFPGTAYTCLQFTKTHCTSASYDEVMNPVNGSCIAISPQETLTVYKCACEELCNPSGTREMTKVSNPASNCEFVTSMAVRHDCITGNRLTAGSDASKVISGTAD